MARRGMAKLMGVERPPKISKNMNTENKTDEVAEWPLWKVALKKLRQMPEFGYGMKLETNWFEAQLACHRDTPSFNFQMLRLRQEVEQEDGYYLHSQTIQDDETGIKYEVYQIPAGNEHQDVCKTFECKMRSYAGRAFSLRNMTLNNEKSNLSAEERVKMEKSAEIAATRLVLLSRERSIAKELSKHSPKLLEKS